MDFEFYQWHLFLETELIKKRVVNPERCTCDTCNKIYSAIATTEFLPTRLKNLLIDSGVNSNEIEHQSGIQFGETTDQMTFIFEYSLVGHILKGEDSKKLNPKSRKGDKDYIYDFYKVRDDFEIAVSSKNNTSYNYNHLPEASIVKITCRGIL